MLDSTIYCYSKTSLKKLVQNVLPSQIIEATNHRGYKSMLSTLLDGNDSGILI